jgi:hypothetical protein
MSNRQRLADWWIGWGLSRCTLAQGPGHSSNDPGQVGGVQVVERSLRFGPEDGVSAFTRLLAKLADVPTPAGPTPRQLNRQGFRRVREDLE